MPVGIAHDEVAGLRRRDRLADRRKQVGERARRRQIDAAAAALVVEMPVGEARHDQAPARVDDFGVRPDARPDRGGRPDGDEFAVLDRERLGRRCALARGEYLRVDHDEVGGLGECGSDEAERDQKRGSLEQHHPFVSSRTRAHASLDQRSAEHSPKVSPPRPAAAMRRYVGGVPLAASTSPAR